MRGAGVDLWTLIKDILGTGLGLYLIVTQAPPFTHQPSEVILAAALVLITTRAATHAKNLITGSQESDPPTDGPSSSGALPSPEQRSP